MELFITIAPKIQGGASGTTAIEGCGFSPHALVRLELLSAYRAGSEPISALPLSYPGLTTHSLTHFGTI